MIEKVRVHMRSEQKRTHDPIDKHDGFTTEIAKARSREQVENSLDKQFGKRPRVKYPFYPV